MACGQRAWGGTAAPGTGRERAEGPAVARNTRLLGFMRLEGDEQLARLKLGGRQEIFLSSNATDGNPEFSPDGQRGFLIDARPAWVTLWLAKSDGTGGSASRGPEDQGSPDWSPDGRWIAFDGLEAGKYQVKVVDASGGHPRQVTSGPFDSSAPRCAMDDGSILFQPNRTSRDLAGAWCRRARRAGDERRRDNGGRVDRWSDVVLPERWTRANAIFYSRPVAR